MSYPGTPMGGQQPQQPAQPSQYPSQPYPQQAQYPVQQYLPQSLPPQHITQPQQQFLPQTPAKSAQPEKPVSALDWLLRIATGVSILASLAFIGYLALPWLNHVSSAQYSDWYLTGLVAGAIAELLQIAGVLTLLVRWASPRNTERQTRELVVLALSLIPFILVVVFAWTVYVYLRERRRDRTGAATAVAKQEMREQLVDTAVDVQNNLISNAATPPAPGPMAPLTAPHVAPPSQQVAPSGATPWEQFTHWQPGVAPQPAAAPALPAAPSYVPQVAAPPVAASPVRATIQSAMRRVIGPSTAKSFSESSNGLVAVTLVALAVATVTSVGVVVPAKGLAPFTASIAEAHIASQKLALPLAPTVAAPACLKSVVFGNTEVAEFGDNLFGVPVGGQNNTYYPQYALPAGLPNKPLDLNQTGANSSDALNSDEPLYFVICNNGATPIQMTSVSLGILSYTLHTSPVDVYQPCSGTYTPGQGAQGAGCGGGMDPNTYLTLNGNFGATAGAGASVTFSGTELGKVTVASGGLVRFDIVPSLPNTPGIYELGVTLRATGLSGAPLYMDMGSEFYAQVRHVWSPQACLTASMKSQIPASSKDGWICP